jgi:hypothetical protein
VIALAPVVAAGTAEAHGGGFGGGGFHAGGFHGRGFGQGGFRDRGFRGDRFRFGGIFGRVFTPATMEAITAAATDTALAI